MYVYAVSFALQSDATSSQRYDSLMGELRRTPNGMVWLETPSFVLIQSNETIEELADRIYLRGAIVASKDILLVIDHHSNMAVARGPIQDKALLKAHFKSCVIK